MGTLRVKFREDFGPKLANGEKTATTRTKPLGRPGEHFLALGGRYVILTVEKLTLGEVAADHHREEGFPSPAGFRAVWTSLHPREGWNPKQLAFYHTFARVDCVKCKVHLGGWAAAVKVGGRVHGWLCRSCWQGGRPRGLQPAAKEVPA